LGGLLGTGKYFGQVTLPRTNYEHIRNMARGFVIREVGHKKKGAGKKARETYQAEVAPLKEEDCKSPKQELREGR